MERISMGRLFIPLLKAGAVLLQAASLNVLTYTPRDTVLARLHPRPRPAGRTFLNSLKANGDVYITAGRVIKFIHEEKGAF
jgi:hypothetical protein